MGDRANIYFIEDDPEHGIYLYTHWYGENLPLMLRDALASTEAQGRWTDPAYLIRIIVSKIISAADDHDSETGWGLSTRICDNEHPILVVDLLRQTIDYVPEGQETFTRIDDGSTVLHASFEEYVRLDSAALVDGLAKYGADGTDYSLVS